MFRIAPTPSGYLHKGNAYSFLLTAKLAKEAGLGILLRIDDLDNDRARPAYVEDIFENLKWLGIEYDLGPLDAADFEKNWSQNHRMHLYNSALEQLASTPGAVFACSCSRAQLQRAGAGPAYPGTCRHKGIPLDAPEVAWRLAVPSDAVISFDDALAGPQTIALGRDLGSFVIRRKDGIPAYQLASVVDDVRFGVTHIVRGMDLLQSTAAQLFLASILKMDAFVANTFYHHPLLMDEAGRKLSKSEGADSLKAMRERGEAVPKLPF